MDRAVTNVILAGLGGQGVIKASDILADAAFRAGLDVKKAEIHGMSQRGGSVTSDVRFGERVRSPMVPRGEADFLVVLDNGTTAMTGQQEHPGTGRSLGHEPTGQLSIEALARALGVKNVDVVDPMPDPDAFEKLLRDRLSRPELSVIVSRRPCILAAADIRRYEKSAAEKRAGACPAAAEAE